MGDYGHDLSFGIFVTPKADTAGHVLRLARRAEAAGLDWVSVQDHPYQPAFLDAWTLLTAIAATTERVSVFPNVANLPLRPPAVLARAVASLDILSGGRSGRFTTLGNTLTRSVVAAIAVSSVHASRNAGW